MTFCCGGNTFCKEKKKNFEQKFEQKISLVLIYTTPNLVLHHFQWVVVVGGGGGGG